MIFSIFGIAIGLCIGTVFKNYRALELVKRCNLKAMRENPLEIIGMRPEQTIHNSQRNLVFVGVMTAKVFLDGRAKAVYDTWGRDVPGHIAFFSSEGSSSNYLPVIGLKNVDDRYPPQKKSFMMLYYMYEHFIDKFEWFIRADDDVYMDTMKLERFLRSVDSSKPQFIGQAGKGNSEEFGLLSLEFDENFCMGGPGVILSRETLRRVAPHIPTCLKNLYSLHEDVEVGRCVQKFAGIPCTWNYEMQFILRHNSSGRNAFTGPLRRKEVHSAITLHPVKQAPLMYRLHAYIQSLRIEDLRQESLMLHRDIVRMAKYLQISETNKNLVPSVPLFSKETVGTQYFEDHSILGINPDLNKFVPTKTSEIPNWTFVARSLYSTDNANPKRKMDSATREGLEEAINEIMENINNFSRQRGRVIEFRELLYGYSRLNTLYGQDIILDLLLIYKKYRGKKMTVPVRRHLYLQRSFTGIFVKEFGEDLYEAAMEKDKNHMQYLSSKVKNMLSTGFEKISNSIPLPGLSGSSNSKKDKIVFALAISGRFEAYSRFLETYEEVAIRSDKHTDLLVVIFGDNSILRKHLKPLIELNNKYRNQKINYIHLNQDFSRGVALDTASRSSYISDNDIILFIDVDMVFSQVTLDRIRYNTIQSRQVYFPIVFSEYEPSEENPPYDTHFNKNVEVTNNTGYFRQYGFGICAIYKSDIFDPDINGFDRDITGWGLEDVKFLERLVKVGKRKTFHLENTSEMLPEYNRTKHDERQLSIFRAPDPSLIHVFHSIFCDRSLDPAQYTMCLGTKANTIGSTHYMEQLFLSNPENVNFIRKINLGNEKK